MNAELYYKKYKESICTLGQHAYTVYFTSTMQELNGCYGSIRSLVYHMAHEVARDIKDKDKKSTKKEVGKELEKTMQEILTMIEDDMRPEIYSGVFDGWWILNDWKAIL